MSFRTAIFVVLAPLAAGVAASVAVAKPELVIVFGPPEANCPTGALPRATVRELAEQPKRFARKCIRVRGVWAGDALYEDLDAYRRYGAAPQAQNAEPVPPTARVGVYAPKDLVDRRGAAEATPIRADMVARVGDCESLWRSGSIAAGYCRTRDGVFLAVHDADLAPQRLSGRPSRATAPG